MSTWNIRPPEVGAILGTVSGHVGDEEGTEGLTGHLTSLEGHLADAASGAHSPPIEMALGEFAGHFFAEVGDMVALTTSAVTGAGEATTHYVNGDLDMAAEAQANAGKTFTPVDGNGNGGDLPSAF
ncbi:hypothetical protein SAMN05421803_101601 [Nocardiopsis flavescens]|uniref:Excreted virulence factor EspC, type VII ESX diderm n=1 Tax=Nocardiopsis flavescens TaxID=758803 RepID=A0A1M6C6Q4_9ACTN|nr:DUF6507 family protein [Nocardiopsis flavescens]SHI56675.1 hypothetical protein SAMN05421803_101601 [Nocardiopsis flavescens]